MSATLAERSSLRYAALDAEACQTPRFRAFRVSLTPGWLLLLVLAAIRHSTEGGRRID
jgi:hypothetical protein